METTIMRLRKTKSLKDLTLNLADQFDLLLAGKISPEEAVAASKMANVIVKASGVRVADAMRTGNREPMDFISSNTRSVMVQPDMVQLHPQKPDLAELILAALTESDVPMNERMVVDRMVVTGALPADYVERHKYQQGGPYVFIRGHLLALTRKGELMMSKNAEGHAVFTAKPTPVTEVVNG
jgi:hypothetical protein